jgi:hypothetical protein
MFDALIICFCFLSVLYQKAMTKRPPIPRKEKEYLQQYLETLEENLKHPQVRTLHFASLHRF